LQNHLWINSSEIANNNIDDDQNGFIDDINGFDFINNDAQPQDDNDHGSHVSGISSYVAPAAKIMAIKALDANGESSNRALFAAINYAVNNGADIINASFGGSGFNRLLQNAITQAERQGVIILAAAGNDALNSDDRPNHVFPANFRNNNIIAVAASDENDNLATFSNYGAHNVDISAPGVDISSTAPINRYATFSGTSMATPYLSAATAMIKAIEPTLTPSEIKTLILENSDVIASQNNQTASQSRLNIAAILQTLQPQEQEELTPSPTPEQNDDTVEEIEPQEPELVEEVSEEIIPSINELNLLATLPINEANDISLYSTIAFAFNRELTTQEIADLQLTIQSSTQTISGQLSYEGTTLTFTPNSTLSYATQYQVTLLSLALNLDESFTFTTLEDSSSPKDITDILLSNRSANCADYVRTYTSQVSNIQRSQSFDGSLDVEISTNKCIFSTNNIPNHDFNDFSAHFATPVSAQSILVEVPSSPSVARSTTALSLSIDNAIMLNGVKLDLLAAACCGVGDGKIGCNDINTPWRYDPMSPLNSFGTDTHNAHTQPDGAYHYHGSPNALFDTSGSSASPVIGFAADGFPIYGSYISDNGSIRKALPSYQLKNGNRVAISGTNPGGSYDGTYRDDYEYVSGSGDLDECNGMVVNGDYGYYITEGFPYVLSCYKGTPDSSFNKRR
jgi:hypothetical protein